MRLTLQKYVLKEFFRVFIPSIVIFEFLIILGLTLQSMYKGADVMSIVVGLLPYFILYALPYALPMALLAATVITYGRMSGDNEVWAMLTSGVHLRTIIIPVAIVGLLFSFVSVAINAELQPRSYKMLRTMRDRATHQIVQHLISAGGKKALDPYYINIQKIEGDVFKGVTILKADGDRVSNIILAREGRLDIEMEENTVVCALRDGEFINISQDKVSATPTVIPFGETTFLMPLGLREHTTFRKYMPFSQLLEYKKEVKREIRRNRDILDEIEPGRGALRRSMHEIQGQLYAVQGQIREASAQAKKAREVVSQQRVNLTNVKNEIKISQDYIRIAEETVAELLFAKEMAQTGKAGKPGELADIENKISEINKTIEDETVRILEAEEAKRLAEETMEKEGRKLAHLAESTEKMSKEERILNERYQKAQRLYNTAEHKERTRDISVAIHKRLAPGFSCLAFVLIGIPVGIMTRMRNMVLGFLISFGIALVVYYPLLVTGEVLAREQGFLPGPTMWGANMILGVIATVFLVKLFRK
ncbi:MAG: LptF/LptG family permease [Candidatus Brocadiales bacterium]